MRVDLYALCWDEIRMLPFFFRHYDNIVDRYIVFDDGSTDGSVEYLEAHPRTEVRPFERTHPDSFVASELDLFESCWKESRGRADWVIVINIDEFLYHPAGKSYLKTCREQGFTIVPALGYQMAAERFPEVDEPLTSQVRHGARWRLMDKLCLFNPDAVDTIGYRPGRHQSFPSGNVAEPPRREMILLHYKYLGFEYLFERLNHLRPGFGPTDRKKHWGHKFFWKRKRVEKDFRAVMEKAEEVLPEP